MDDERGDATEELEIAEAEEERVKDEVDRVKEEAGARDNLKHIENTDQ